MKKKFGRKTARAKAPATKRAASSPKPESSPTVLKVSDDESRKELFHVHRKKIEAAEKAASEATANSNAKKAAAEKDGFPKLYFEYFKKLKDEGGVARSNNELVTMIQVRRWAGAPVQLDLFSSLGIGDEKTNQSLYTHGYNAAWDDLAGTPPQHLCAPDQQIWLTGFHDGRTARNVDRSEGFKPLSETAAELVEGMEQGLPPAADTESRPVAH